MSQLYNMLSKSAGTRSSLLFDCTCTEVPKCWAFTCNCKPNQPFLPKLLLLGYFQYINRKVTKTVIKKDEISLNLNITTLSLPWLWTSVVPAVWEATVKGCWSKHAGAGLQVQLPREAVAERSQLWGLPGQVSETWSSKEKRFGDAVLRVSRTLRGV